VVNIILKKNIDGASSASAAVGYDEGGGRSLAASASPTASAPWTTAQRLVGMQAEKSDPVWGYQRDLTKPVQHQRLQRGAATRQPRLGWSTAKFTKLQVPRPGQLRQRQPVVRRHRRNADRPASATSTAVRSSTPGYRTLKNSKDASSSTPT
jgi:hypothetical protein